MIQCISSEQKNKGCSGSETYQTFLFHTMNTHTHTLTDRHTHLRIQDYSFTFKGKSTITAYYAGIRSGQHPTNFHNNTHDLPSRPTFTLYVIYTTQLALLCVDINIQKGYIA